MQSGKLRMPDEDFDERLLHEVCDVVRFHQPSGGSH